VWNAQALNEAFSPGNMNVQPEMGGVF
jgi:hypothetical protein